MGGDATAVLSAVLRSAISAARRRGVKPSARFLVVGDSAIVAQATEMLARLQECCVDSALVCTGSLSAAFKLSPAPRIDVPANGGHFVEPDSSCWQVALNTFPRPTFALSC